MWCGAKCGGPGHCGGDSLSVDHGGGVILTCGGDLGSFGDCGDNVQG